MIDVIFDFNGTLDKIVGDEIMAFWGAPTDDENQAEAVVVNTCCFINDAKQESIDTL